MNQTWKTRLLVTVMLLLSGSVSWAQTPADKPAPTADEEAVKMERQANEMISNALELIDMRQEERGLKMLQSVPEMFPKSKARFRAYLAVAERLMLMRQYDLATKQLAYMSDSENPDQQAEGLYQMGICYYELNQYDKAFTALRRVTNDFPWSVYANEAYYYIGQCHFRMGRWAKAIEALEMVGTSVPPDSRGDTLGEIGQRLYVKIHDKDLIVLQSTMEKFEVELVARSGDRKKIEMESLGKSGEYYIGSIQTSLGKPNAKVTDRLFLKGRDSVSVEYIDVNTEGGERNVTRLATIQMVSTASGGFTDGAYREYTKGVFGNDKTTETLSEAFIRIKDLDRSTADGRNTISARVYSEYKVVKEEDETRTGVELEEKPESVRRHTVSVTLTESAPHSGIFHGKVVPYIVTDESEILPDPNMLRVMKGDELGLEYEDEFHVLGDEPREVQAKVKLLVGKMPDVTITDWHVDDKEIKARKNLIESKIFLRLAQIHKDVGLNDKANEKARDGMERVEEVIASALRSSLDRNLVEEGFSVKWDLLLVQDKLQEAIAVCRTLMQMFPDSSLVDQALLKIGMAKADSKDPGEAIVVLSAILGMPRSDLKAEAQFRIAEVLEKIAERDGKAHARQPDLSRAMLAYKACADNYPTSSFAGDALYQIGAFYIKNRDYFRAIELMDRVMSDYPDASFLDRMLLLWGVALYRNGNADAAIEKFQQVLTEYPQTRAAGTAKEYINSIGGGS